LRFLAIAMAVALPVAAAAQAPQRSAGEYELKAAFLFNFAKFVEWPAEAFAGDADPIHLCLLGGDPFEGNLELAVRDKTIGGRRLQISRLVGPGQSKGCQILFVSGADGKPDHGGNGLGVLTVGESGGFAAAGGVIDFVEKESRLAFEVNLDAAQRAGLKISSKLLSLAKIVHDDPSLAKE
jgi:hypothetical protein